MTAYYNEFDRVAAHVLQCLIKDRIIAPGVVDTRSITDVQPSDLSGFTQVHLFAGAGIWSVAARMAGWPDDRPIFTGSCPCQPFSQAGKRRGTSDPRHLWPDMFRLIQSVRPTLVVGEQVSGKDGYAWFDGVASDLEGEAYACRALDLPACAVGAPHIRNRLFWCALADTNEGERRRWAGHGQGLDHGTYTGRAEDHGLAAGRGAVGGDMADTWRGGSCEQQRDAREIRGQAPASEGQESKASRSSLSSTNESEDRGSFWADAEWLLGADGKARRVKPGLRLLVDGMAGRSHALRVIGNSIVPQVAAEVLKALMDTL